MKKEENIYDRLQKFLRIYLPVLSFEDFKDFKSSLKEKELSASELMDSFGYEMAILQANPEDPSEESFLYYELVLDRMIGMIFSFKEKIVVSIGSGLALSEIFVAKELFSKSHIYCLDISKKVCIQGRDIARKENVKNISFIVADANYLPFKEKKLIDIIWSFGNMGFDKTSEEYKNKILSITKPKGIIIFA